VFICVCLGPFFFFGSLGRFAERSFEKVFQRPGEATLSFPWLFRARNFSRFVPPQGLLCFFFFLLPGCYSLCRSTTPLLFFSWAPPPRCRRSFFFSPPYFFPSMKPSPVFKLPGPASFFPFFFEWVGNYGVFLHQIHSVPPPRLSLLNALNGFPFSRGGKRCHNHRPTRFFNWKHLGFVTFPPES